MKKLFVDTNIVLDLLARRQPHYEEAAGLFSLADKKQIALAVSALTIANTSYTLLRQMDAANAKAVLRKLRLIVEIVPLDDKIIGLALNDEGFVDFEDALQYFTALENGQDIIITRNLKDFKTSTLPTLTARQFLETFKVWVNTFGCLKILAPILGQRKYSAMDGDCFDQRTSNLKLQTLNSNIFAP